MLLDLLVLLSIVASPHFLPHRRRPSPQPDWMRFLLWLRPRADTAAGTSYRMLRNALLHAVEGIYIAWTEMQVPISRITQLCTSEVVWQTYVSLLDCFPPCSRCWLPSAPQYSRTRSATHFSNVFKWNYEAIHHPSLTLVLQYSIAFIA